jgi:nucleoside-diphosphate-sugar epimerase
MRVFVTSASSYLGKHIINALLRKNYEVVALVRQPLAELPPEVQKVVGRLEDLVSYRDALYSVSGLIHCGGISRRWPAFGEDYIEINVNATRRLFKLAAQAKIPSIVYTSSIFALGPTGEEPQDEETQIIDRHWINGFEQSKALALRYIREKCFAEDGAMVTTLLPGLMVGSGARSGGNYLIRFIENFKRGKLPGLIEGGKFKVTLSSVRAVARAHVRALAKAEPGAEYILGGEIITALDLCKLLAKLTGTPAPENVIPYSKAMRSASLSEMKSRFTGKSPRMCRHEVEFFSKHWAYIDRKARAELGYDPPPLEEILTNTLASLQEAAPVD